MARFDRRTPSGYAFTTEGSSAENAEDLGHDAAVDLVVALDGLHELVRLMDGHDWEAELARLDEEEA